MISQRGLFPESIVALNDAQLITYTDAASLLCVDKRTIRRRVSAGRYIAYGTGSGKRIIYSSILADIQRYSTGGS